MTHHRAFLRNAIQLGVEKRPVIIICNGCPEVFDLIDQQRFRCFPAEISMVEPLWHVRSGRFQEVFHWSKVGATVKLSHGARLGAGLAFRAAEPIEEELVPGNLAFCHPCEERFEELEIGFRRVWFQAELKDDKLILLVLKYA